MSRLDKITEAVRREVSIVIHDKIKDHRLGFITITRVEMTADLRHAKIFYSVLGSDKEHKDTKDALDSALGYVRKLISEKINLKFAPEIIFREDRSSEYSVRIQEVLDEIKGLDNKSESQEKREEGLSERKRNSRKRKKIQ